MSKHTPGKWWRDNLHVYAPCGSSDVLVAEVMPPHPMLRGKERREDMEFCEANARLIAAAPELLEALKKFNEAATVTESALEFSQMCDTFIEDARAAIAKATGEQA